MNIIRVHSFKHEVSRIEEKINFFFDYKYFLADQIGKAPHLPLDTPLSLLNKILHQLKYNRTRCEQFVYNHIKNFNFYDDYITMCYENKYGKVRTLFQKVWNKQKINNEFEELKVEIELLYYEIEPIFLDDLIKVLHYYVCSKYSLNRSKYNIKKTTQILVAFFLLNEHSRETIKKLLYNIDHIEKLLDQLKHIKTIHNEKNKKYFIFKIRNCKPTYCQEDTFNIKYGDVEFVTTKNKKLNTLRRIAKTEPYKIWRKKTNAYKLFFKEKNQILAIIELSYLDEKKGLAIAKNKVRNAINYFKMIYKNEFISYEHYYFSTDSLNSEKPVFHYKTSYERTELKQDDLLSISSTEKNQNKLYKIQEILDFESLYTSAKLDNSLTKYWQYLECLLPKKIKQNGEEKKQVMYLFKKIMQKERDRLRDIIAEDLLINLPLLSLNNSKDIFKKKSFKEVNVFYNSLQNNTAFYGVCKFLPMLKTESIKEIIRDLKNDFKRTKSKQWENYYESLILELYEYRNSDVHKGKNNEYLERKLKLLIPPLMSTFRWRWRYFYMENSPDENGIFDFDNKI